MKVMETPEQVLQADNDIPPDSSIESVLHDYFGFCQLKSGQRQVIESLLSGRSALAVFPTGGGKSLCYQLTALMLNGLTVVVSPLIALMKDQIDFLTSRGIAAARLDSSLGLEGVRDVNDRVLRGDLKLLYVAPERFNNERFIAMLRRIKVSLFAIDEAHCISEWGHNFRPDYLKLAEISKVISAERILALTATATSVVADDICAAFQIAPECATITGFYRKNLHISIIPAKASDRDRMLLTRLSQRQPGPTIIYVTLQKTAESVAASLAQAGLEAQAYHAGMDGEQRSQIQEWWMDGANRIVVATIAFGMGIDKANVRYVYHYNLPKSLESYSQEIGRAGRDDDNSIVEMLACPSDIPVLENFIYGDTPDVESLHTLVDDLFDREEDFSVSLYDLAGRHDLKSLVLKTSLTYLEISGLIVQGTPFYAGYQIRPIVSVENILARFNGEPAELVSSLFRYARKGRTWFSLNPDEASVTLAKDRGRIVRALEYMEQHRLIELKVSDSRQRYKNLKPDVDRSLVVNDLYERFTRREHSEIARLQGILEFIQLDKCLSNALSHHFGELRHEACGACSVCVTGESAKLDVGASKTTFDGVELAKFLELRDQHMSVLGSSRKAARFFCGMGSPIFTRLKLSKHPLFGTLESHRYEDVCSWCETWSV